MLELRVTKSNLVDVTKILFNRIISIESVPVTKPVLSYKGKVSGTSKRYEPVMGF